MTLGAYSIRSVLTGVALRLLLTDSDKHSSLALCDRRKHFSPFCINVSDEEKNFYDTETRGLYYKTCTYRSSLLG
jgi:hypothetical protein